MPGKRERALSGAKHGGHQLGSRQCAGAPGVSGPAAASEHTLTVEQIMGESP